MTRQNVNDLLAFLAVAREGSFTKAAVRFGVSQSALSHTIRQLEARLGIRLLTRTTRAVAPTEAGERLLERIGPHFDQIEVEIDALNELREKPAGTIRINASDYAISSVLWPKLKRFSRNIPTSRSRFFSTMALPILSPNAATPAFVWVSNLRRT